MCKFAQISFLQGIRMTYLKDIKLCVDCTFFGTPQGQRDRCLNPKLTTVNLVDGGEEYPYCYAQRRGYHETHCGSVGRYWVLDEDSAAEQERKRQEFEEAMRDAPF